MWTKGEIFWWHDILEDFCEIFVLQKISRVFPENKRKTGANERGIMNKISDFAKM